VASVAVATAGSSPAARAAIPTKLNRRALMRASWLSIVLGAIETGAD
jgi:hypothetical protein